MTVENSFTTIQVSKKVHSNLEDMKIIKQESFNTVIERLIKITRSKLNKNKEIN